jgi:hypothetical protein
MRTVNDYIEAGLTHSIHTSERKSFRGCRRRWDWISRQFYYPNITARPLEFGVAFHGAMEKYYEFYLGLFVNPDPNAALQLALAEFKKITKEQKAKYIKLNSGIDPDMEADYKDRVETGVAMLEYYFGQLAPTHDKGLKPIKVEIKFEVPIANPETGEQDLWCKCDWCWRRWSGSVYYGDDFDKWQEELDEDVSDRLADDSGYVQAYKANWQGLPVTYGGRIDILFEDELGRLWIGDWKTAARLSGTETSDEYLWNDDQITAYVWALRLIGFNVAGFIYAEIKKAVPEEPEPLKVTRLGRLFSVSKNINTTWEMYENTVKENDPNAYANGLYTDFIEYLKVEGPQFHRRHMVMRNEEECRQAGINIWKEAKEMTNPDILIYPNQGRFHCKGLSAASGCAFWDPCLAKNRGEDYQYALDTMYQKLDRHYWEEAKPTTDKRMESM